MHKHSQRSYWLRVQKVELEVTAGLTEHEGREKDREFTKTQRVVDRETRAWL